MKHKGSPRVEIVATGDELIYGRILDTNSNWLAKRIAEMGAELRRVTMVGDDYDDMKDALFGALDRDAEIIIFTGGLGPSEDDFTVDALGRALGKAVVTDPVGVPEDQGDLRAAGERHEARCPHGAHTGGKRGYTEPRWYERWNEAPHQREATSSPSPASPRRCRGCSTST